MTQSNHFQQVIKEEMMDFLLHHSTLSILHWIVLFVTMINTISESNCSLKWQHKFVNTIMILIPVINYATLLLARRY